MSVSRWKVMACSLGLSLGGLAICAGQSNERPATPPAPPVIVVPDPDTPIPPPVVPATPSSLPPLTPIQVPAPPTREIEIEVPEIVPTQAKSSAAPMVVIPAAATPREPTVTVPEKLPLPREMTASPVLEAPIIVPSALRPNDHPVNQLPPENPPPAPGTKPGKVVDLDLPPVVPSVPPVVTPVPFVEPKADPAPTRVTPPAPLGLPKANPDLPRGTPPAPSTAVAPDPLILTPKIDANPPRVPPPTTPTPPPLPPVAQPQPPAPQPQPQPPVRVAATTKLKMLLRLGDGKPRFEIRTSDSTEMLLKVYGEKVEMQSAPEGAKASPIAGVTAMGKVRFTGPGIEGTCDQLTVLSGTGEVMLKGNVHIKTKRGKTWSEMTTEKMIYQIGASGLTTATSAPNTEN